MIKQKRIIIVGAGPVGCYMAQLLKHKGLDSLLIEEHKEIGRPVHCAGLVGKKVFDEMQISPPVKSIINTINGAEFFMEDNKVELSRDNVAYVIDREQFDKELGKNLNIRFETKFIGLEKENGSYIVETDRGEIEADIVIGADGARSAVRDFVISNRVDYLKGVQFRMKLNKNYNKNVEVHIEKPYFYWIIPEPSDIVRIGVLSMNPYHDLTSFIKEKKIEGKILAKFAGMVPLTHFKSLSKDGVFLVGDSASQIKPLSYGGIYMGMRAAEILVDCIYKEDYKQYSSRWHKHFGRELNVALKARDIFQKLEKNELKKIFSFVKEKSSLIEKKGDFENHSLLVWEFLKDPNISKEVIGILLRVIKAAFRNKKSPEEF